jgi:PmbA protein
MFGQYSANQLGTQTTGNAGGVNNLEVSSNFEGDYLELAKQIHQGFLVTDLMGQGVNITNGNYSRGASGFWIENGEILFPVSGVTIAGNLKDMFQSIELIGSDVDPRLNTKVGSTLINQMTIAG